MHQDIEKILLSQVEIETKSAQLAKQLKRDYADKQPILLGLLKGSAMFMAELMKTLDIELQVDFMTVSSYDGATSTGHVQMVKDLELSVFHRHVILVEDIVDTGRTLEKVIELLKDRGAATLEVVTLLDKPEARMTAVKAKYIGFSIPKAFVVGYGLDYHEKYRNLPYIGILKASVYSKT